MVAVIAGNGLGLGNSSLTQLGQAQGGQATLGQGQIQQYLNIANGNLVLQNQDEGLVFDGQALNVLRTYNSQGQLNGAQSWSFGFSRSIGGLSGTLNHAGSRVVRTADDGSTVTYVYDSSKGAYVSTGQSGAQDTLTWDGSGWTWTDSANKTQEIYNSAGQLITLTDIQTNSRFTFGYSQNLLTSITSINGDKVSLSYNPSGQLTSMSVSEVPPGASTAVTRQQVGYQYDTQGRLSTVTTTLASDTDSTVASYTTSYTYDGTSNRVASVTQSDGTTVSFLYTADASGHYRVTTVTTGVGADAQITSLSYGNNSTTVTDALGRVWTYTFDGANRLTQVAAPAVNGITPVTLYQYDANGNLLQKTDADGAVTHYTYDAVGNLASVVDGDGNTVSYTYTSDDQVASRTTYTQPAQGTPGQAGYVAASGAQTTYYVYYGHELPRFIIDPSGLVTQNTFANQPGGYTLLLSTQQYLGTRFDLSGFSPSNPPSIGSMQNWLKHGPVSGTLSQGRRTDYTYDVRGQLQTQIQWSQLDSNGNGIQDGATLVTTTTYDAQGKLLQTSTAPVSNPNATQVTSYAYDGMGRLLSITDPLGQVTSYTYTDSGHTLAVTHANGLTVTQLHNSAGQVIASTASASGQASRVTQYLYDVAGEQVAAIDAAGNASYTFYDADGHVSGTVDATGAVTAYTRDPDGRVTATTQYATRVDTSGWMSAGALSSAYPAALPVPAASADDRTSMVIYDAAGRQVATVDGAGDVVAYNYDGVGNLIETTAYAQPLTSQQMATLLAAPVPGNLKGMLKPSPLDRTSTTLYDIDNRVVATIDPAGYVTTTSYDLGGRAVGTHAYATAISQSALAQLQTSELATPGNAQVLATLQGALAASSGDQLTTSYYDDQDRLVAQFDAGGFLTTVQYDEVSHSVTTTRYPQALGSTQIAGLTGLESNATLVGMVGGAQGAQSSSYQLDADGRKIQSTDTDGTVTTYQYDAVGHLRQTIVTPPAGHGVARTQGEQYDAFGDLTSSTDGANATTSYAYNALGERVQATDALGNTVYSYYDADGRVAYTVQGQPGSGGINTLGNVTAYTYNAEGQLATRTTYAAQLSLVSNGAGSGTTLNAVTATLAQVASAVAVLPVVQGDANGVKTTTYDAAGRVASVVDGNGYATQYTYNAFGELVQKRQQLSQAGNSAVTQYSYDQRGERTGEQDGVGTGAVRGTSTSYDAFGRVISDTDGNGSTVTYSYDPLGRQVAVSQVVDGQNRVVQTIYDAFDRVLSQTDALGLVTRYQYDATSLTTTITTPEGRQMTVVKDPFGDTLSTTDNAGQVTQYTYDGDGRLKSTTDPAGDVHTRGLDADGNLLVDTDASGRAVAYTYDANGRVLTRTVDPNGAHEVTTYTYDGQGREVSVTDATGAVTRYSYDADGQVLTQVQDANGAALTTSYSYDGAGNVLTVTAGAGTPAASTTQYTYDALNRLVSKALDPNGLNLVTTYAYDANDNLVMSKDADGNATYTVYNEANEAIYSISPYGAQGSQQGIVTAYHHDADGRLVSTHVFAQPVSTATLSAAIGQSAHTLESTFAQVAAAATPSSADAVSYQVYDQDGRVLFSIDPMGVVTESRYNVAGQVAQTLVYATPLSPSSTLASALASGQAAPADVQSALASAGDNDANARVTFNYYDDAGRAVYSITPTQVSGVSGGLVVQTQYDAAGRVTARSVYGTLLPSSTFGGSATTASVAQAVAQNQTAASTRTTQYIYDGAGQQVAAVDPMGLVSYTLRDADERVVMSVDATGAVVQYKRDGIGRVVAQTAYATTVDTSSWLAQGKVTVSAASVVPASSAQDRVTQTAYDLAGRISKVTTTYVANGLSTGSTTTYSYDAAGRLVSELDHDLGGTAADRLTRYFYDAAGQTIATLDADGYLATSTYDAAGQVVQTTAYATATDPSLRASGTLSQLLPAGNANDRTTSEFYDAFGRLAGALDADGYFTQYSYDMEGRQLSSQRYATPVAGSAASNLASITAALAGTPSRGTTRTYDVYGDVLSEQNAEGTVTLYGYDNLGHLLQTQVAAGTADERDTSTVYNVFGDALSRTDSAGATTTYAHDQDGRETSSTDTAGNTTWFVRDADGRVVFTIRGVADASGNANALGEVSETDYDAFGEAVATVTYSGRITAGAGFAPTLASMRAFAANPVAGSSPSNTDKYSYDAAGNLIGTTDANGNVTTYQYDGFGDRIFAGDATDGSASQYSYDNRGHRTGEVDGAVWNASQGPLFQAGRTGLSTSSQAFDAFGEIASATDGDGAVTTYAYDHRGDKTGSSLTVQGAPRTTSARYDAYGRVLTATDALGLVTTYAYNDAARSLVVTAPGGLVTTTVHSREGQTISLTDATGRTTSYSYDKDGRLLQTQNADGSQVSNTYDQVGNLLGTKDAAGRVVSYTYDAVGRVLTQTVDPTGLALTTRYVYDGRSLKVSVTDPAGVVTSYAYDGNGNVQRMVEDAGHANVTTNDVYNGRNQLTQSTITSSQPVDQAGHASTYTYDTLGRVVASRTDDGKAQSIQYAYDPNGNLIKQTDGNGSNTYYFYNEAGERVYSISDTGNTAAIFIPGDGVFHPAPTSTVTQYWHDDDGHVVASAQYATTLNATITEQVDTLSGQAAAGASAGTTLGALAALTTAGNADRTNYAVYNANGQLRYTIDGMGNVSELRYNAKGQVVETLTYGQAIGVTPALAASLRAASATPADIQAALGAVGDNDGNARATYSFYDTMGRLAFSIRAGQAGGIATAYQYDADGNQIAQLVYGDMVPASLLSGSTTTDAVSQFLAGATHVHATRAVFDSAGRQVYAIDTAGFVTETRYDQDGRVTWTLHYANAIDTPSSWGQADVAAAVASANPDTSAVRGTGNVYDSLGNVVQTLDTLSSAPTGTYTYDARGLKTSYTNRDGQTWTYAYDANGNLTRQTSPAVAVASYNADGSYAGTTQEPVITQYERDGNGQLAMQVSYVGTGSPSGGEVQYVYDDNGQVAQTRLSQPGTINAATGLLVPANGTVNLATVYNAFGEPVATQDANGEYSYKVYDNDGRVAYELDANGYVTGYTYDAYGEQATVTRYAQAVNLTQLGSSWTPGNGLSTDQLHSLLQPSANDRSISTTYDSYGNKVAVTQSAVTYTKADGSTATGSPETTYTYDAYGNVTSTSVLLQGSPSGGDAVWATTYTYYDALGHKTMSVDPKGYATTWSYNGFGDVTSTTEWATPIATAGLVAGGTQPGLPPAGNPATAGADRITQTTYDNDGRKTSESVWCTYVDGSGNTVQGFVTTTYAYDGEGRVTAINDNGRTATTQYDALGRIVSVTGPQEQVLVANWQALLAANPALDLSSASLYTMASQVMTYAYDLMGNKLVQTQGSTASAQAVSTYYQYDRLNRLVASVTPLNGDALSWTSSQAVYKTYDNNGNVLSVQSKLDGSDGSTVTVSTVNTYDNDDQLLSSTTLRSGAATPDKAATSSYNAFGEVTGTGDGVNTITVTVYDAAGCRVTATDPKTGVVHTYGYNLGHQLITDSVPLSAGQGTATTHYTRDLDGNAVAVQAPSTSAATGSNSGTITAVYDRWGNVLSSTDAAGNTTTYTYDERNLVLSQSGPAVSVVDVHGNSSVTTPVKTTGYDVDGSVVLSTDENGNVTRTGLNATGQVVKTVDGAGAVSYVAYDALGNEVAEQNGIGHITFHNVDALGRTVQQGDFVLSSDGTTRVVTWQQAYVLDQNGDRLVTYDGAGSALLQTGDATDAAEHATYYSYDSQGRVLSSQNAVQRAATLANLLKLATQTTPSNAWAQAPFNATFEQGDVGWDKAAGWTIEQSTNDADGGSWVAAYRGTSPQTIANQDRVPVAPGQTITAQAQISLNLSGTDAQPAAAVLILWYDANGNQIAWNEGNVVWSGSGGDGGYHPSTVTATAPPGAAYAALGVSGNGNGQGYAVADDVSWNYLPPTTNMGASWTPTPPNADFTQGVVGWQLDPGWSTGNFGSGPYGTWTAQFSGNTSSGSGWMVSQDRVPVTAGQSITASAGFDVFGDHGGGAVQILWYDANGNQLPGTPDNNIVSAGNGAGTSTLTSTAPTGAVYAAIGIAATNYNDGSSVVCSGVSWNYVPPAGVTSGSGSSGSPVSGSGATTNTWTQIPFNPTFELGDVGWDKASGWTIEQSTNDADGGHWVAAYSGTTPQTIANRDRVPVVSGQTITATAQISLNVPTSAAQPAAAVLILWYDANGNQISWTEGNVIWSGNGGDGHYHASAVTGTAPPGAAYAALGISGNGNGEGYAVADNVSWDYVPPTGATGAAANPIVSTTYTYDRDGNLIAQGTANGDNESWVRDAYGRTLTHTDLSGAIYHYHYDAASGQLMSEDDNWSEGVQSLIAPGYVTAPLSTPNSSARTYYADGQLATITYADGSKDSYSYDVDGNQTRQESTTVDGNGRVVHTVTQSSYDSHNRLSHVVVTDATTGAVTLDETYSYDAAGNRREVHATSNGTTVDAWYTYDGDNRVTVSAGALQNGSIVVTDANNSYGLTYDGAGNAVTRITLNNGANWAQTSHYDLRNELIRADYSVNLGTGGASRGVEEVRSYDANGNVIADDQFYALGTTVNSRSLLHPNPDDIADTTTGQDVGGELASATINRYDDFGRLIESQDFAHAANWNGLNGDVTVPALPTPDATSYGSLTLQNAVVYHDADGNTGYDAMGHVVAYQYRDASGRVDQYDVSYLRKDDYLEASTAGHNISGTANVIPTSDQSYYDNRGNRVAIAQQVQYTGGTVADTVRVFAYDGNGQIIERRDGTSTGGTFDQGSTAIHENQHYVYVNGQQVAHYDDGGTLDVLDQVTAFSNTGGGSNGYVVQAGDTLKSIAQTVYGNASLWYVIAQANALSSDNDLSIGQDLTLPQVTTNANDATTFKPYNPGEISGSTAPTLPTIAPPPPPPSSSGCNPIAEIVVIAVVVAATVFTAGAAAAAFASLGPLGSAIAAGAVAGAAGSAAGQLTGDALGISHGFDWGQVAEGAIGGAIGGGVTAELAGSGVSSLTSATSANGLSSLGDAVQGAVSYAGNDLAAHLTDESAHFSWVGLVASSVGSAAGGALGPTRTDEQIGNETSNAWDTALGTAAGGVATKAVSEALGDNHVQSWDQIAENVAGNAIGAPIGQALLTPVSQAIQSYRQRQQQSAEAALAQITKTTASTPYDPNNPLSLYNAQGYQASALGVAGGYGTGQIGALTDAQVQDLIDSSPKLAYVSPSDMQGSGASEPFGPPQTMTDTPSSLQLNVAQSTNATGSATVVTMSDGGQLVAGAGYRTSGADWQLKLSLGSASLSVGSSGIDLQLPAASPVNPYAYGDGPLSSPLILSNDDAAGASVTDLPAVNVTASVNAGTSAWNLPAIGVDNLINASDFTPDVSPLVVPSESINLAPVDVGALALGGAGSQATLNPPWINALVNQYQQSEHLTHRVGQWFGQKEQQIEQNVDQWRSNITAYGDSQNPVTRMAAHQIADTVGFGEGAAIGAYKMALGIMSLADGAAHLTSPYSWMMDPQANLQRVKAVGGTVATLDAIALAAQVDPQAAWTLAQPVVNAATADYRTYWNQGDYSKLGGRIVFDAGTILAGGFGTAAKFGEAGDVANTLERLDPLAGGVPNATVSGVDTNISAPFQANGLNLNPLSTPDGTQMVRALEAQGLSTDEAVAKVTDLISTGSTPPIATPLDSTDTLIKFVPQGAGFNPDSAFWATQEQASFYMKNPSQIPNDFGLPLQSNASAYDVYARNPIDGAVVFQSDVAPTQQGTFIQSGGAGQSLMLNGNYFTPPYKIGTVYLPGH